MLEAVGVVLTAMFEAVAFVLFVLLCIVFLIVGGIGNALINIVEDWREERRWRKQRKRPTP